MASVLLRTAPVVSASSPARDIRWPSVAGVLIAALYLGHVWIFGSYIADDAGISLAYARNIVAGYGPVLYRGGEAVEGYSNPLWVALLGLGAAVRLDGHDGIPLLKVLGVAFGIATLALTAVASSIAWPRDLRVRWLAPALLASLTPFVFWTAAGLENALYAFLLLLTVTLQLRELEERSSPQLSALALSALALTRPEGVAFSGVFLLHRVLCGERGIRLLKWIAIFAVPYAAFLTTRMMIFGELVPNTYYAKVALYDRHPMKLWEYMQSPTDRGTRYVLESIRSIWPLLLAAGLGIVSRRYRSTSLLFAALIAGTATYAIYVGGDFWPAGRFFTAILPLIALAVQHAVNRWTPSRLAATVIAALIVGMVLNRSLTASSNLRVRDAGDALISLQGRLNNAHRLQALAFALHIEDPLVLDADIGGPSVAGLRVLDLGGLADVHIAKFHYYPSFFRTYIFDERRPAFIRTHATWTSSSGITAFPEFGQHYVAIRSYRDRRGLHGEFVRRDLLNGAPQGVDEARPPASWRQAIEDGRARRRREAERATTLDGSPPAGSSSPR